jgi:hypothetical protein
MAVCAGIRLAGNYIYVNYNAADGTKGASYDDPFTLADVYDTAVDGGWNSGVIEKIGFTGGNLYYIHRQLVVRRVAPSLTYFQFENDIMISDDVPTSSCMSSTDSFIKGKIGNIFSQIISRENKPLTINNDNYGEFDLENFVLNIRGIITLKGRLTSKWEGEDVIKFKNVYMSGSSNPNLFNEGLSFTDVTISNQAYGLLPFTNFKSNLRTKIFNCPRGVLVGYTMSITLSNLFMDGNASDIALIPRYLGTEGNFIDCVIDTNKISRSYVGYNEDCSAIAKLLSTFNINITDGDGATATLYNNLGEIVDTTILSGEWGFTALYFTVYVEYEGGVIKEWTKTTYEPFTLKVVKEGYQTLEIPDITITPGKPTDIFGKMEKPIYYNQQINGSIYQCNIIGEITDIKIAGEINSSLLTGEINSPCLIGDIY